MSRSDPEKDRLAASLTEAEQERFWEKVERADECWEWQASKTRQGYGQVRVRDRILAAHRVAWSIENGLIPNRLGLDHICRNPACVRPSHLEPVPQRENMVRGVDARIHCPNGHPYDTNGRKRQCEVCAQAAIDRAREKRTRCKNGHRYTPGTMFRDKRGHRRCRLCAKTHCPRGHPYDDENTYVDPTNGWRQCIKCRKAQVDRQAASLT